MIKLLRSEKIYIVNRESRKLHQINACDGKPTSSSAASYVIS